MMTRTTLIIALAATAALAGCKPNTIVAGGPDESREDGANVAAAGPVALPPSITATKTYRCKDNSLVYIDWMSDDTARARKSKDEVGTPVAPGSGELTGTAASSTITYKGQSCKA